MKLSHHCRITVVLKRPHHNIAHCPSISDVPPLRKVMVGCGPCFAPWAVAGKTVAFVRRNLATAYNIHPEAIPFVGGEVVDEDYVLQPGDDLSFHKMSGQKGVGEYVWTEEQFCQVFQITSEQFWGQVAKGLRVLRLGDGSVRITETAVDEFIRGGVMPDLGLRSIQGVEARSADSTQQEAKLDDIHNAALPPPGRASQLPGGSGGRDPTPSVGLTPGDLPDCLSSRVAASLLGVDRKTLGRLRRGGLLRWRIKNPASSRKEFLYERESVLSLATDFRIGEPAPRPEIRRRTKARSYVPKHIKLE